MQLIIVLLTRAMLEWARTLVCSGGHPHMHAISIIIAHLSASMKHEQPFNLPSMYLGVYIPGPSMFIIDDCPSKHQPNAHTAAYKTTIG